MKYLLLLKALILAGLFSISYGCSHSSQKSEERDAETVELDSVCYTDSMSDPANNYGITVITKIKYPKFFKDSTTTRKLKELLCQSILESEYNDSLGMKFTAKQFSIEILNSYKMPPIIDDEDQIESKNGNLVKYEVTNQIRPSYIGGSIIGFRKISGMKKGDKTSLNTNFYYTFNTRSLKRINITDIFNDDDIEAVNDLLKESLLKQENATDASQLIDLGYFNIDNLSVNNNFYLSDDGIVFNYEPNEIACYAIGEVRIKLNFNDISQFIRPDSGIHND